MSNQSDLNWELDKEKHGWVLPPKAHWCLRLPIVRQVRFVWLAVKIDRHYQTIGSFGIPTGYDEWVLYAIVKGWC